MKQKPVVKYPGTSYLIDGPYINLSSVIAVAVFSFILIHAATLFLLWHEININGQVYFPLPSGGGSFWNQLTGFYLKWMGSFNLYRGESYRHFDHWMTALSERGELPSLTFRWGVSVIVALVGSYKLTKASWKPVLNEIQTRGRVLVEGDEAYEALKADTENQRRREAEDKIPPAFIFETKNGFNPNDPEAYKLPPSEKIVMSNGMSRPHIFLGAGSRRGKTQKILKWIMEFLYRITHFNENIKCMIIDTGKADYSRFLPKHMCHIIGPHEANTLKWAIGKDLKLKSNAEEYWSGKIADNDKDPFWNNSSRSIGVASNAILIETCGDDWSFNNMMFYLKKTPELLAPYVLAYYPEALQIIQMEGTTLSNVMGTNESYTKDLLQLAEIWDGYQYKHDIDQMSVRLLKAKYPDNLQDLADKLFPQIERVGDEQRVIVPNLIPNVIFRGLIRSLNEDFGNDDTISWTWGILVDVLKRPYKEIFKQAVPHLTESERKVLIQLPTLNFATSLVKIIGLKVTFDSDEELESYTKKICAGSPATALVIKAMLRHYRAHNWNIENYTKLVTLIEEWNKTDNAAILDILANNLSSKDLASLSNPNDYNTLLSGLKPVFENHKIWDKFEGIPTFSLNEWIYDENPKKKFLILKTSGQFSKLTSPLVRGMLFYAKGLIDDDMFMDDRDMGITRRFYILMDEFQALGNIKEFIEGALERFASKGVVCIMAVQDLSQLTKLYSEQFVDFLLANTGNIFFIGSNIGKTAEIISNAVGKKWFKKLHTSITYQENGKSMSQNWQEHEGLVITPDEINSKLGIDLNGYPKLTFWQWLCGVKKKSLPIRYLYLGAGLNKAYILETPACGYKVLNAPDPADWRDSKKRPKLNNGNKIISDLIAGGGAGQDYEPVHTKKPFNAWVNSESFEKVQEDPDWTLDTPDKANEVELDISHEESEKMLASLRNRAEQAPIYILPVEEEGIGTEAVKEIAIEAITDSHAISAVKHVADALVGDSRPKTVDRARFKEALERARNEK